MLRPGQWAASLVEYARFGQYALDLQLRGYANKNSHWATLYVGLTKVLDLHSVASRGFRLSVNKAFKADHGWEGDWEAYHRDGFSHNEWRAVEDYLESVIPAVGDRFLREGAVQSAVSAFQSRDLTVIDREAALSFSNQAEKDEVAARLAAPLLAALDVADGPSWWGGRPKKLGGECDALAVAADGSLLAIEIKPARALSTIPWAPVQVRHYANLFSEWARTTPDAADVIDGMLRQRREVDLSVGAPRSWNGTVRPIVAIQRRMRLNARQRLGHVQDLLVGAGLDDPKLEMYEVNLAGRLELLDL